MLVRACVMHISYSVALRSSRATYNSKMGHRVNKIVYELYQNTRQYVPAFSMFVGITFPWRDNVIEI